MLVSEAVAEKILERVVRKFQDQAIIAYVQDVVAVPADRFK